MRGYNEVLKNYLLPEFGSLRLDHLTEERIAKFKANISQTVSPVRANNILGLLRYILKVCLRRKLIGENPATGIDRLKEPPTKIDPLSPEDLQAVLNKISHHYKPLFTCLAWTGARPNELMALRWSDVNFKKKEIRINKGRVRGHEDTPKTSSSCRVIPIFSIAETCLKELRNRPTQHIDDYVFLSKRGLPINKHLDQVWRTACQKAKIEVRPSYQLRHTFASICLSRGVEPGWIAKVLGHSTIHTTFRHYARYIQSTKKENESKIEQLLVTSNNTADQNVGPS